MTAGRSRRPIGISVVPAKKRRWTYQLATVATVVGSLAIQGVGDASAQRSSQECPTPLGSRESPAFRSSPPSDKVQREIEKFQRRDPDASFQIFNCHVGSFATRPKSTVPGYASKVLRQFGVAGRPQSPELLTAMSDAPKLGQDMDANPNRRVPMPDEGVQGQEPEGVWELEDTQGENPYRGPRGGEGHP